MSNSKENQSKDIIVKEGSAMFELIELIKDSFDTGSSLKKVRKQALYATNPLELTKDILDSCYWVEKLEEVIFKVETELKEEKEVVCQN